MRTILIAGGGPAGLLAALAAARAGATVHLFEKNGVLGKKLAISGGGRANLTNVGDHRHLVEAFGKDGRFLFSALHEFDNYALIRLMEEIGIAVKEEDHGRIFPLSDSARSVVEALERELLKAGVVIHKNSAVQGLQVATAADSGDETGQGETVVHRKPKVTGLRVGETSWPGDAVIVTTGGISFPKTGTTGDGYPWLADLGHTTAPLKPGLAPLLTPLKQVEGLMGLSLRDINMTLFVDGKQVAAELWDMMFAHFGLTGPAPLSLSHYLPAKADWKPCHVILDLIPKQKGTQLRESLRQLAQLHPNRKLENILSEFHLPPRLIDYLGRRVGLPIAKRGAEISAHDIETIALALKQLQFEMIGPGPMEGAMVTAGGISLNEIDPKTLRSKCAEGLYIAGEIIDLAAKSGGYNLQAAWSTGWVAGKSAALQR